MACHSQVSSTPSPRVGYRRHRRTVPHRVRFFLLPQRFDLQWKRQHGPFAFQAMMDTSTIPLNMFVFCCSLSSFVNDVTRVVNEVPQDKTLSENELQHGDIILFQIHQAAKVRETLGMRRSELGLYSLVHSPYCLCPVPARSRNVM